MYLPPPGRPVSSPPSFETTVDAPKHRRAPNLTPEQIKSLRADYSAGLTYEAIMLKYGFTGRGVISNHTHDLPRRKKAALTPPATVTHGRPVRMDGEPSHAYANRVKQWMCENDPEWFARWKVRNSAGVKRYWKKRRAKMEREAAKAAAALPAPAAPVPAPAPAVAPPPTFWQRWFGWVRW